MLDSKERQETIISLENVKKHFPIMSGLIVQKATASVKAVDGVSFNIGQGKTYGLVGESGCGKTTTARMILLVEKPSSGEIRFYGRSLANAKGEQLKAYRATVQAVFQDPWSSMNPRMRVSSVVSEPLTAHKRLTKREVRVEVERVLEEVGLHPSYADRFPHEFSGGQRQRIAIARALSLKPKLIVLDEPVSALDVSIRAQILNLLKRLQESHGLSYLLIAHNLATVRYMSHRVGVMYLGKLVEEADSHDLFTNPLHPYTQALISAALSSRPDKQRVEIVLSGEVPSPLNPPSGCTFHPRCPVFFDKCSVEVPSLKEVAPGHLVSCHRVG